jgi:uncharacterized protein
MNIPLAVLTGIAMGVVFGFALEKSRVFEPGMIVGQMQLRNFTMVKVFLSAVVTGLLIIGTLYGLGAASIYPKPLLLGADIIGGLILGAGIAIAGACPGTVAAQVGVGYRDSLFTLAGGVLGAIAFIYLEPTINPMLIGGQRLTLDVATGLPFAPLAYGFAGFLAVGLLALERWRPWRADLGADGDGFFEEEAESAARRDRKPHPAE